MYLNFSINLYTCIWESSGKYYKHFCFLKSNFFRCISQNADEYHNSLDREIPHGSLPRSSGVTQSVWGTDWGLYLEFGLWICTLSFESEDVVTLSLIHWVTLHRPSEETWLLFRRNLKEKNMQKKNSGKKQKASLCYKSGFAFISLSYPLGLLL